MWGRTGRTCALALVGAIAWTGAAQAKTFEVTRKNDPAPGNCKPNDCSLREAVQAANERAGADKVVLPERRKPYRLTIAGDTSDDGRDGDLDVANDPLAIVHPGKGKAKIRGIGIDDRIFDVFAGAPLRLSKVKVSGGDVLPGNGDGGAIRASARVVIKRSVLANNETDESSGAIQMNDASLAIDRSVLAGNRSGGLGGAIDMDGDGALTIARSVFRNNSSGDTAGAIRDGAGPITISSSGFTGNEADVSGGAIRIGTEGGAVRISRVTLAGNRAGAHGGAIDIDEPDDISIKQTTISGNSVEGDGGGIEAQGAVLNIVNSTIADNSANGLGGGIHAFDGADVSLNAVTVARNRSGADDPGPAPSTGGGLHMIDSSFEVRNSLIGLNTNGAGGIQRNDCEGETYTSLGNNLLSTDTECDGFTASGDLVRSNPKIGALKKNGGPTKTIALKKGSPAIGKAHKPSAPNRDQRGRKRDNKPDIGAFERGA